MLKKMVHGWRSLSPLHILMIQRSTYFFTPEQSECKGRKKKKAQGRRMKREGS